MNLLSDKIAVLYGDLQNPDMHLGASWMYDRYTRVNDFAYINNESQLHIQIKPTLLLSQKSLIFLDEETGEEIEYIGYREMTEPEFFQYSTVYDFGYCDYDDIKFAQRHIDSLQTLSRKYHTYVVEYIRKMHAEMYSQVEQEIKFEIDKEILAKLSEIEIADITPVLKTHTPEQYIANTIANSSVSFTAMNKGSYRP